MAGRETASRGAAGGHGRRDPAAWARGVPWSRPGRRPRVWGARAGAREPCPPPHPPRRRGRRAPEAGGDFLCPPRRARRAAVSACRRLRGRGLLEAQAEGRGGRRPGGRHRAAGQADGGEWGRAARVEAGGRDARLPGAAVGARPPVGAGRKIDAASGSLTCLPAVAQVP